MRLATAHARGSKLGRLLRRPRHWKMFVPGIRRAVLPSLEHAKVQFGARFATVVDVGASRGQFALFALARFPGTRLICFEPLAEARATAAQVLAGHDVEMHGVALGASPGEATLHVSERDDSSSLLSIGSRQTTAFPGTHEVDRTVVRVDVLDAYVDRRTARPCLLKLDVQGGELDVLRGARAALVQVDELLVEASFVEFYTGQPLVAEVVQYLAERSFRLVNLHNVVRDAGGVPLQADLLFRR